MTPLQAEKQANRFERAFDLAVKFLNDVSKAGQGPDFALAVDNVGKPCEICLIGQRDFETTKHQILRLVDGEMS